MKPFIPVGSSIAREPGSGIVFLTYTWQDYAKMECELIVQYDPALDRQSDEFIKGVAELMRSMRERLLNEPKPLFKSDNPNPIRNRSSCPECGLEVERFDKVNGGGPFDCKRCGAHYAHEDFIEENEQKYMALNHKAAVADLSGEEE